MDGLTEVLIVNAAAGVVMAVCIVAALGLSGKLHRLPPVKDTRDEVLATFMAAQQERDRAFMLELTSRMQGQVGTPEDAKLIPAPKDVEGRIYDAITQDSIITGAAALMKMYEEQGRPITPTQAKAEAERLMREAFPQ